MRESGSLTLTRAERVYRLIDECREQGEAPDRWRPHLLTGITALLGAKFSALVELATGPAGPGPTAQTQVGLDGPRAGVWDTFVSGGQLAAHLAGVQSLAHNGQWGPCRRRDLLADDEWYGSDFYNEWCRPCEVDDGIIAFAPGAGGIGCLLVAARAAGGAPFSAGDAAILHLVQTAITPHLGRTLATSADPVARLSRRLRQTLDCLLDGDSEKQAAARLGVSPATVREYVQSLYRQFEVASRAELLAHFLRRHRAGPAPSN